MQRYNYQNVEAKEWSLPAVLGVTALVSLSVGATVGLVTSGSSSSSLYAPAVTRVQSTTSTAAVPVSRRSAAQVESVVAESAESVDEASYLGSKESFSWGPVAALVTVPAAVAAFLLSKAKQTDLKLATAGVAASAVLAGTSMTAAPANAAEGIMGLTPCAESKKFGVRKTKEIKALEKREKLYEPGSKPYLALEATKARTEARFAKYAKDGLLCGADGLPHLISDPGLAVRYGHAGETLIPTVGFLYVAGYIGTTGRTYLQEISTRQKPTQSEIIIDVPLATSIAFKSWDWPGKAIEELSSGKLLAKDSDVFVSRR